LKRLQLAWLAALLALGGCAALPPAPPVAVVTPEDLLSRLQARQQQVRSFQARGRVTLLSPERNYAGTSGLFKGLAPTTLRVDLYDPLGRSLLNFLSDGHEVEVFFPREARLCRGQATPANLAALIPPAVTLHQALRLLVAAVPLSPEAPDRLDFETAQGQYLLEWRNPNGTTRERLWLEGQGLNPVKDDWLGEDGLLKFSVEWGDFGRLAPDLPGKIILRTFTPAAELRLTYSELKVNPALTAADLALEPPPGVTVVPLP